MNLAKICLLFISVMPLTAQTPAPLAQTQTAPAAPKKPQTAILGANGGLFVFNPKHEAVGYCEKIEGKVVDGCKVLPGHTLTEVIQGMIDTLIH